MNEERKNNLALLLKISDKKEVVGRIKQDMTELDFWLDHEKAGKISRELSHLEEFIARFELAQTDTDLDDLEQELFYYGEHDNASAYLSIHAGAGGTEAQDWAHMLLRMYQRFSEKEAYATTILEQSPGEEVGIKSATLRVAGFRAYGNFKSENGVHRLVRISPFDADKARHTSFALVEVIPEIEKAVVSINPEDLKIDVYRASGHGGQSVNTTDSAVRITHIPTKLVVTCQNERSQLQNKLQALKILTAKLQLLEEEKEHKTNNALKGETVLASWGNQIRSYVLQPYQMVKDLRTDYETAASNDVLDGDLKPFIEAYLRYNFKNKQ